MNADDFRRLALSLPEAIESEHMGHPDFRVRTKIFATLGPGETWGMVKLTPEQQTLLIEEHPQAFEPIPGAWGLRGATRVLLAAARKAEVRHALVTAFRNVAPKRLADQLDEER